MVLKLMFVVALLHCTHVRIKPPDCARALVVVGLRNGCGIVKPVPVADRFEVDGRVAVPQECPFSV